MDKFRELAERLRSLHQPSGAIYQGIVKEVDDIFCTVTIGGIDIPEVRLRASESADDDTQMLVCPKVGSAVILGSLSGDLAELVVLSVDKVDHIIVNGGKFGGLIKIEELVTRLNNLEKDINNLKTIFSSWVPVLQDGGTALKTASSSWATSQLTPTKVSDIEDNKITH